MFDSISYWITYNTLGLIGVALYIGSYAGLQLRLVKGAGYCHTIMNGLAALLVLISLTKDYNLSSVLIQLSWILISGYGLYRLMSEPSEILFNEEEANMKHHMMQSMPASSARILMDAGTWKHVKTGAILSRENTPNEFLSFIAEGSADIIRDNQIIARVDSGTVIGEMTYHDQSPATATVVTTMRSRVFCIPTDKLRKLLKQNVEVRADLEQSLAHQLRHKLRKMSESTDQPSPAIRNPSYHWSNPA